MTLRYFVETWDPDKQKFTPQDGVPRGPYTRAGLQKAIKELRRLGYPCEIDPEETDEELYASDPCVLIWAEEEPILFER